MNYALINYCLCARMRSIPLDTRNADNDNDNNKDNKKDKDIDIDIGNAFFRPMRSHKNVQNLFKSEPEMFITCLKLDVLNIVLNNQSKIHLLQNTKKRHIRRCVFEKSEILCFSLDFCVFCSVFFFLKFFALFIRKKIH